MTRRFARGRASSGKSLQNPAHRRTVEPRLAGMHTFDRFQNELCWLGLMDDAPGSINNCPFQGLGVAQAAKDEHGGLTRELRHKIEAALPAKIQVEQHYVRSVLLRR